MPTDGEIFKSFIQNEKLRPVRIYESMQISKQAFYKLFESDKFEEGTVSKIEKAVGKQWDKIKETNVDVNVSLETKGQPLKAETIADRSLSNLTESNRVLSEANNTLAEANRTLAEANLVISKNHDELIQLTKLIVGIHTTPSKKEDLRKVKNPTSS